MLSARGLQVALTENARVREHAIRLFIEVDAVGDDDEGPVAGHLAQYLLGEEHHRHRLAGALGVPVDAHLPALARGPGADFSQSFDGVVDAEVLVVLGDELHEALWASPGKP